MVTETEILESNVIANVRYEINKANDKDTVNKLYRQARVWVRFHCHYALACNEEDAKNLNKELKYIRWNRLKELGYTVPTGGFENENIIK